MGVAFTILLQIEILKVIELFNGYFHSIEDHKKKNGAKLNDSMLSNVSRVARPLRIQIQKDGHSAP